MSDSPSSIGIVPEEVLAALKKHDRILITAHANPDGDAVGASVALGWALRTLGKEVLLHNETGFPDYLSWLRLPSPVLRDISELPGKPGLVVALDSGDAARLGEGIQNLLGEVPVVNIDHHPGNPEYGSAANWVDPAMSATGEMIGHLAEALELPLEGALAEAGYVALVSDTGSFAYGNTRPSTLRMAARLLEGGLDIAGVRARLDNNWSEGKLRLWGRLMSEARILDGGKLGVTLITRAILDEYGALKEDAEGFVEQLRRIKDVRVALLLREVEKDGKSMTRISLRSSGADDVRKVAAQFGGGGHRNAAGATVDLPPEKALIAVQPYIRHVWN